MIRLDGDLKIGFSLLSSRAAWFTMICFSLE